VLKEAFKRTGFDVTVVHGGSAGDLVVRRAADTAVVGCRHWGVWRVDTRPLRAFADSMRNAVGRGVFVTCGAFTDDARTFAAQNRIELIDGAALERMLGNRLARA
jgi:restriction system protein